MHRPWSLEDEWVVPAVCYDLRFARSSDNSDCAEKQAAVFSETLRLSDSVPSQTLLNLVRTHSKVETLRDWPTGRSQFSHLFSRLDRKAQRQKLGCGKSPSLEKSRSAQLPAFSRLQGQRKQQRSVKFVLHRHGTYFVNAHV